MTAAAKAMPAVGGAARWEPVTARAPRLGATMLTYLDQLAVSQRPGTIQSTDTALRLFAGFVLDHDPGLRSVRQVRRPHIEAYKRTLVEPRQPEGRRLKNTTVRMRLGMLRLFFERIIEWGWDDAPPAAPSSKPTSPKSMTRCPSSWMTPRRHGSCGPPPNWTRCDAWSWRCWPAPGCGSASSATCAADAVMIIGDAHWLRIPVGKLHHDRLIPLHPALVDQLAAWRASVGPDDSGLLLTNGVGRSTVTASTGSSNASGSGQGSTGCTPTGCATPSPPKPSTGG